MHIALIFYMYITSQPFDIIQFLEYFIEVNVESTHTTDTKNKK